MVDWLVRNSHVWVKRGPLILLFERFEVSQEIGHVVIFEHEDRHFHRMADLNAAFE